MSRLGLAITFLFSIGLVLAATVPMNLALAWYDAEGLGLSANGVSGSIWNGQLKDARFEVFSIGDAEAKLSPMALLRGEARVTLRSPNSRGTLVQGRVRGIAETDFVFPLEEASRTLSIPGRVRLQNASVLFDANGCRLAQGRIAVDLEGAQLAGELRCEGNAATAFLTGTARDFQTGLALRVEASGRYRVEATVTSSNPALVTALSVAGLMPQGAAMVRVVEGNFGR